MSLLKGLGGIANGWMKFGVAVAAAIWLGGQALDRILPVKVAEKVNSEFDTSIEMLVSTTGTVENPTVGPKPLDEVTNSDPTVVPAAATRLVSAPKSLSAVEEIGSEMSSAMRTLLGSPIVHAIVTGIVGLLAGFFGRPSVDWLTKRRRISLARQRLTRLEEDRQLLAEVNFSSKPNQSTIQNVTKTSVQLPGPQV